MKTILERFYDGAVFPAEQIVSSGEEFQKNERKIAEKRACVRQMLPPDEKERIDELETLYLRASSFDCYAGFSYGFKLAVQIMCEVFTPNGGTIGRQ